MNVADFGAARYEFCPPGGCPIMVRSLAARDTPTSSQEANVLGFGDGTEYNLSGMDSDLAQQLVAFAANGTDASDIPDTFDVFRK
jgi:hypothetical protein